MWESFGYMVFYLHTGEKQVFVCEPGIIWHSPLTFIEGHINQNKHAI